MQNREDNSPKPAQSRPRGSTLFPKDFQGMQMTPHAIEQFHRVLFGNLLEGIVTIDKDSIITYINDIAAGSCGYEAHEMIGKPVQDFISLEELEKVSELSKKSSDKEIEFTYRKRDGTDIYLYIKVGIVSDDRGDYAGIIATLKDITEKKAAEKAINEKNRQINSLLETTSDVIYIKDAEGRNILINRAYAEKFNIEQEQVYGKTDYEILPAELADQCSKSDREVINSGKIVHVEEEFYLESGQTVFMDTVKCPIVDDQGRVTGIAGASRDITARKKEDQANRQRYDLGWMTNSISEEFINIKIENLKFGLHKVLQKVGSFLGFDRAFIVVLPGIASEVEPVHYWCADGITRQPEYMNTLMQREDSEALKKLGEGKALSLPSVDTALDLTDAERSLMQGDGMRSLIIFPMISGDDVMGYMGFDALYEERELSDSLQAMVQLIVNIVSRTFERIKAEEALKESEKNFREMIDHATDAIMVDDFEGNIMVVNKQQALRTGYSKEEILSMNIMDLFPYSFGFKDTNERRERLVSGEPVIFEHIVQGKDGSKLDVEVKLAKTTWNGKPAIFSISRDITQRKKIEQELRESEARFRILIEQSRDGIVILDQEGNVYQSNKQFAAMIGYPLEEVSRLNVSDWEYLYSREQVMEMIRTVDESGDHFETLHCRKDGTTYSVEISTNGAVIGGQKLIFCICRDITERKRDEEALRESEARFRELVEQAADAILVHDWDGNVLMANTQAAVMAGYTLEELTSMNMADIFHDVTVSNHRRKYWNRVKPGSSVVFETNIVHKDGKVIIAEVKLGAVTFSGKPAILAFSRDITERRKAEKALRESEQNFRELIEKAVEGIIVNDLSGKILLVNNTKCRMMGYSREEFLSHNMTYFFDDIVQENHMERYWQKMEPGGLITFTREESRKDGSTFPAEIELTKIIYGGRPAILTFARDISERKKAEMAIKAERDKAQKYLDVAGVLMMAVNAKGTIEMINRKGCEVLEYAEKEIIGKNWIELFLSERGRALANEIFSRMIAGDIPVSEHMENIVVTKTGSERIISWNVVPIRDEKGVITGMLGSGEDITEQRKAEKEKKEMESKARLTSHLASIGEMASGVAHEINNPLTGVIGYSQLLMGEDLPQNIREYVSVIHDGAQRVSDIVRKLLSFARQNRAERTFVNINELLRNTLALMAYELRSESIEVITRLSLHLPLTLADGGQIQQVFTNIIRNALMEMKIHKGGGTLNIKTAKRHEHIVISFEDEGPGIEAANLHKIFDPFFTTRKLGEGTGLGLSVCHGIVGEHGGTINVKSTLGEGATFTVNLPVVSEKGKSPPATYKKEVPAAAGCARILIVDDEPEVYEFLKTLLTEQGHKVEVANNAADALNLIENDDYNLVLLDIVMPGMNGFELYECINSKNSQMAKKILFMTGDVMNTDTEYFLAAINADYVTKPFDLTYFKYKINALLGS